MKTNEQSARHFAFLLELLVEDPDAVVGGDEDVITGEPDSPTASAVPSRVPVSESLVKWANRDTRNNGLFVPIEGDRLFHHATTERHPRPC